ncbi:MAG: hypothetical protein J07HX5_02039 [halophilic archaeon J07HX5]|nr:MAG: hypothetical protein J07HX5_02039 [halophilic archaeon J07HX5]
MESTNTEETDEGDDSEERSLIDWLVDMLWIFP